MGASITEEGFDELARRMSASDTMARINLNEGLRAIGHLFVPAKGSGPLAAATPKVSGKLRRSTFFQIMQEQAGWQRLEIRQPAKTPDKYGAEFYGYWVREGTEPHEIRPRYGKALRFEVDGAVIFAKVVHHPGTRPNPYHRRVMKQLRPQVDKIILKVGGMFTAYLSGKGAT